MRRRPVDRTSSTTRAFVAAPHPSHPRTPACPLPAAPPAAGRELPPLDPDWYFVRAASVARKIYLNGGIGVGALAHWYGKAKSVSTKPQHHHKASRGVLRHILIQLEAIGVVEKVEGKAGRVVTREGQKDLDTIARTVDVGSA